MYLMEADPVGGVRKGTRDSVLYVKFEFPFRHPSRNIKEAVGHSGLQ